ncbi:efflux RND transporter permease subunit [Cupriavidus sp. RAF12]|uniref:efflux RND transporter permease subunit n=1 Tax=Cupriavidus sp. RAF12 TaxID=3233050 RepID=UPI003F935FF3
MRPIVMTLLAFIPGAVPLFVATGAGSNSRHSIGTGIVGGMIAATSLALLFVPLFSWLVGTAADKWAARGRSRSEPTSATPTVGESP